MNKEELKMLLISYGAQFKGNITKCILCDDNHPSAGIYEKDGKWRYKCFKCGFVGDEQDIKEKLNGKQQKYPYPVTSRVKVQPDNEYGTLDDAIRAASRGRQSSAVYKYTNPDTNTVELCVVRFDSTDGKSFAQISNTNGRFCLRGLITNPLYNRTRIKTATRVFVVEGEKCVHAMHEAGLIATTSPGGASSFGKADWTPLYGKEVYIVPDNDEPGIKYAKGVFQILQDKCKVAILDTSALDPKEDIADISAGNREAYINSLIPQARTDINDYMDDLNLTFKGVNVNVSFPFDQLTKLTKCLRPSAVTVLCGGSGVSKTYFMFQSLIYWHTTKVKWALMELEENKPYWISRALAQKLQKEEIADVDWRHQNSAEMLDIATNERNWIIDFAKHIWCGTTNSTTQDIIEWIEDRAKNGYRIIVVDPITARATKKAFEDDFSFLNKIKTIAEIYQVSIFLSTHPTKQAQKTKDGHIIPSVHALAGGASIERFCACVLWLQSCDYEEVNVFKNGYSVAEKANRFVHILKTRDGKGTGCRVAFDFDQLTFNELGCVVK